MPIPIIKMVTIGLLPSPLKVMYYKFNGAQIGKNVSIGLFSILTCGKIEIDEGSKIGPLSFISCKKLKLGKRVKINMMVAVETGDVEVGDDTTIMEQVVIGGMLTPRSKLKIGKRVKIFPYSFLNPTEPITIADDAGIGGANYIFTHGTWQNILDGHPSSFGPVSIERGVWLPWRVFILPNVTIGEYTIIGADSTVTRNIPPNSIAIGSPAKVMSREGQHVHKLSILQKDKIVKDILNSLVDYLNYIEIKTSIDQKEDCITIKSTIKNKEKTIHYYLNYNEDITFSSDSYYIFLDHLPENVIQNLINNKVSWFDIEGKKAIYVYKDSFWEEIKNYFSRYGIRFEYLN